MLFLYNVQSPVNIGLIMRAAEQFGDKVAAIDSHKVFADPEKSKTISDFACGALTRHPPQIVENLDELRKMQKGRVVATCLASDAIPLNKFTFQEGDIILLGNEYDGLPEDVIQNADVKLYIPLPEADLPKPRSFSPIDTERTAEVNQNGVPNLNVSTAAAIISYAWRAQRLADEMEKDLESAPAKNGENKRKSA